MKNTTQKARAPHALKTKVAGLALGVALAIGAGAPAYASGVPVIDVAAIAEAIKQYQQMVEQLKNMEAQLKQAEQLYDSMTGGRGMENVMSGENRNVIPTNWQETLAQMNGGAGISDLAQSIKQNASKVDADTLRQLVPESVFEASESWANSAASAQASAGQVYDNASGRFDRLQALMDAIPRATDAKAIADLQARIGVESAMLQNEQIKMAALQQAAHAQTAIENQQVREMVQDKPSRASRLPNVVRN